ncbi:hypothetical protein [Sulfitobacter sp. S190]|uniref:hypothetical protein n=1 Tax=Sulfitobacter sp. S190 TaxID=2867022 RepID=UPI0021A59042|nr:hypothetical protein [Sulfitobacter sp. S190]UWR23440.1 hypothetical protein K3756_05495 [Sulfitobacter sp. S190]
MKNIIAMTVIGLGLAACQTTGAQQSVDKDAAMRLATQADMALIDGKTLTLEPGKSYVVSSAGTIRGSWEGKPLVGTYEMRDGYFCRVLTQGPNGPAPEDCQLLVLEGDTLRGTRNRGEGASFRLTVS